MKKKIIFIFTLTLTFFALFLTSIQNTYALETDVNELDTSKVTAVNDSSGTLMGVRITDTSFVGKNLLIGLDLPEYIDQDSFYTGYDYSGEVRYKNVGISGSVYTSLLNYSDDNSVEFQMYWDSEATYYEIVLYHLNDSDEKVSDLPSSLTLDNITSWFYIKSADESVDLKYPFAYVQYRNYEYYSSTYYQFSDLYTGALKDDKFYDNHREQIDLKDLYFNLVYVDNFQPSKNDVKTTLYYEVGFNSDNVTRVYKTVSIEDGSYPTLEYNNTEYIPGSYISVNGWDINDYEGNIVDEISSLISFSHEDEEYNPLIGMTVTTFDYGADNWYETVGTYPVIVSQNIGNVIYSWPLFITLINGNQAPVIEGPTELEFLTKSFSLDFLYEQFTVTDDRDTNLVLELADSSTLPEDNFTSGTYTAVLKVTDSNGSETEYTVTVDLVNVITSNTIIISNSVADTFLDNWISITASTIIVFGIILFLTKFKGLKNIKKIKRRR